ncbi:MAG: hypothetical protein DRP15_01750 [Candidatus Aenigmatarchaeota archaeon]|nr:MAG: hypothetical protein DRP15_01750 [Candidatus Aenigmarchaeota archaeon]
MKVLEERFVTWAEAKNILEKRKKEKELGYEQKNALEHLRKFTALPLKKVKEIEEELKKIERLKEKHIVMIINMLPQDVDELNVLFANEMITLSEDEKKQIVDTVKKFS